MQSADDRDNMYMKERLLWFLSAHWRGVVLIVTPLLFLFILFPFPPEPHRWTGYVMLVVATYWVSECIPLPITSFIPAVIFPMTGILSTRDCLQAYINDSVLMFLGSLMLAAAIEQCGLHKRMAYSAINFIGYSHYKLLFGISTITMFISMWITNTAATTMVVPINFAILRVFERQGAMELYEKNSMGEDVASPLTVCYFCIITYAATIGGIGTLVGTATNLAFKGLFTTEYPHDRDYLSFPLFSAFGVPLMLCLQIAMYLCMIVVFLGWMRPGSAAEKRAIIPIRIQEEAKKAIERDSKQLGPITCWELSVFFLFLLAIALFFCRSPQIFDGWADVIRNIFNIGDKKFILDSCVAMFVAFLMFLLPYSFACGRTCTASYQDELPRGPVKSILDWKITNSSMPYSFMFLLGGGFAIARAASVTGLNQKIGVFLKALAVFPTPVTMFMIVVFVVFVTNFASNVATANILVPMFMQMAREQNLHPLGHCVAAGFSASFCFMLPVGTPGNLIVQSSANIPTQKMIVAGLGPTITTIIITTLFVLYWAPVVWPELK